MRHTMGQDWGGRRKVNPDGAPKVTAAQVREAAERVGIRVERRTLLASGAHYQSNRGAWFYQDKDGVWRTLGETNYWALWWLENILKGGE